MRIALVGYRGSGKSTIGKILAEKTGWELVCLDELIEKRAGKSIPEIVEQEGWERFRQLEREILKEVIKKDPAIFDLGGGVVEREENRKLIKENCFVVWLKASPEVLAERIKHSQNRPSLTGKDFLEEISEVLARREPLYQELAHLELNTEQKPPQELAEKILENLNF